MGLDVLSSHSFIRIYLLTESPISPTPSSSFLELANQFNRTVGCSEKIIGAGRLFKIPRPRIDSDSQPTPINSLRFLFITNSASLNNSS